MRRPIQGLLLAATALAVAACDDADPTALAPDSPRAEFAVGSSPSVRAGGVYLMTNAASGNEVLVFGRAADGSLTASDPVPTGGLGTSDGLGNQGALALTENGRILLVVNPGSDDVTSFRVRSGGLEWADKEPSGGDRPISLTVHGGLVYVLNGGSPNSIAALRLAGDGSLELVGGSSRPLSGNAVAPAQVSFSPDGRVLAVSEKATSLITTYTVGPDGLASGPGSYATASPTPFGFAFDNRGHLIASEVDGTGPNGYSNVSSYAVGTDGAVSLIDGPLSTMQIAACWIAISNGYRFAYSTNGGSGTISGVGIGHDGSLSLLDADGVTGDTGAGSTPLDADFSAGGRYLYVLAAGIPEVAAFAIDGHGGLEELPSAPLPAGTNGMAAW